MATRTPFAAKYGDLLRFKLASATVSTRLRRQLGSQAVRVTEEVLDEVPADSSWISLWFYGGASLEVPQDLHSAIRTVNPWDVVPNIAGYMLARGGGHFDDRVVMRPFLGFDRGDFLSHGLDLYLDEELAAAPFSSKLLHWPQSNANDTSYERWFKLGMNE